jgi:hypothetical protein
MPEYVKDNDGDVWEDDGSDQWYNRYASGLMTRAEVDREFGPLTPCDADGEPLTSAAPVDARALLANAFDDYARRLADTWRSRISESNPFERCARETAAAVRSGEVDG